MSFNSAMLEAMRDKGLTLDDAIDVLWAMEGGRPAPKISSTPANDRPRRLGSNERRRIYEQLCERDGELCCECGAGPSVIWRKQGVSVSEEGHRFTLVWPTTNLEVDHRTPLSLGGGNSLSNLWLLCQPCHKAKSAREAAQRRRA